MAQAKKTTEKEKEVKEAEVIAETKPVKEEKTEAPKATAKAGKRSAKAAAQAEEKKAKEARRTTSKDETATKKPVQKPPRSRQERAGKKFRQVAKLIEKDKLYSLAEALELATKTNSAKFDATVELHVNLGVDPKQADQNVRGTVALPAGTGKTLRVAVVCESADDKKAKDAGADVVGAEKIMADLDKEQIKFDVLIATPNQMAKLAKYARLLGPKGLMPNPKSGTVTANVAGAVRQAKAGRVEYRVDSAGIIHLGIGKASFGKDKLTQNADAIMNAVKAAKPASTKGTYIRSAYVSTTMGPSIKVQV